VSGTPSNKGQRPRTVSARARLRPKSQLTLPEEVTRALLVNEGDEIEFRVDEDGAITVRGYVSIPAEDAWLYATRQAARRAPDPDLPGSQAGVDESATRCSFLSYGLGLSRALRPVRDVLGRYGTGSVQLRHRVRAPASRTLARARRAAPYLVAGYGRCGRVLAETPQAPIAGDPYPGARGPALPEAGRRELRC